MRTQRVSFAPAPSLLADALFIKQGDQFLDTTNMLPHWLYVAFIPNDKTNLGPSRVVHFIVGTFFVIRYVPRD
ncbi:OpgC domain-containing protein [Bradyrhizobium erythrophlei]|uniref:OpgC domain-containing protein n=1 Tax=Bradyrhizobium erythrophlei TaxID=1437360 RepID=UPI000AEBB861|nr:OpgC domain-containing protein [Bradyrhizobium erythrophlei]